MKVNRCYHCGNDQQAFYAEENGYTLVKCTSCGLLYVTNRPDDAEITSAHKQGSHRGEHTLDVTGQYRPDKINAYLKVLHDIYKDRMTDINSWLDIGCGYGEFISALDQFSLHKIHLRGSEPNHIKIASARKRGLDVDYLQLENHNDKYDAISLLNVFSHLPDPPAFLSMLRKNLSPRGELFLQTGDTANFTARQHYRPFYLPDHLSFASEKIICDMLKKLGFEILAVRKYPYRRFSIKGFIKEFIKLILPGYQSNFNYYLHWKLYSSTDMYIRARLNS